MIIKHTFSSLPSQFDKLISIGLNICIKIAVLSQNYTATAAKGPGLIRGIFGLRFSEKVQFPVFLGLFSYHKGNMPYLQYLSSKICFDVLGCHGNIDNNSENAIFSIFHILLPFSEL